MSIPHIVCVFVDASDGHPILGHFARQVGRSGEIRGPGMTWMTYMDAEEWIWQFQYYWYDLNYIKVGMLTVFLWSEVEYQNVSLRFSQVASNLKMFFLPKCFVAWEERIFDICLLNQSNKIGEVIRELTTQVQLQDVFPFFIGLRFMAVWSAREITTEELQGFEFQGHCFVNVFLVKR